MRPRGVVEAPHHAQGCFPTACAAAAQSADGLLARALAAAGWDRRRVAEWVAAGLLVRVGHGQYRAAALPVPALQCLAVPWHRLGGGDASAPKALLTGTAVLALHQAEGFGLPCRPLVLVDRKRSLTATDVPYDVRGVPLAKLAFDSLHGLPCTRLPQAFADAALDPDLPDRQLRVAFDDLRNRGLIAAAEAADAWRGLRHMGARRMLAMAAASEMESEGERECFAEVFAGSLPLPDCQVVVLERLRVDFVFLAAALIVEYYGRVHDTQVDRDATRTYALRRAPRPAAAPGAAPTRRGVAEPVALPVNRRPTNGLNGCVDRGGDEEQAEVGDRPAEQGHGGGRRPRRPWL